MEVSREQVKALRQADNISFRFSDGKHTIEPSKRVKDAVFGDSTVTASMEVSGRLDAYGKHGDIYEAFYYLGSCRFDPTWTTIAALIRADDDITLMWTANNDSEALTEKGVFIDELRIIIRRGKKTMTFYVYSGAYTNQTARMCRRHPLPLSAVS